MKRWLPLIAIVIAGIAAVIAAQRQHVESRPTSNSVLTAAADAQHEMTRLPYKLDRMPDDDEIELGNQLAQSYSRQWTSDAKDADKNRAPEAYLQLIGARAAAGARRKLPYRFHYIPEHAFVNAFALPGGHVFVGEGLLALMKSEDALIAVLGHEVEHIDLRHCAERTQTEAHLRHLGPIGALVGLPVEIFLAGYSKEQELEADRDGTTLAVQAGYSPLGILQLFGEFEKLERTQAQAPSTPVEEAAQLSLQTIGGYFRSHPPSAQRERQVLSLMQQQHWPTPPLRPMRKF